MTIEHPEGVTTGVIKGGGVAGTPDPEYTWDNLIKDLALSSTLTLSEAGALVEALRYSTGDPMRRNPGGDPGIDPYDALRPLVTLHTPFSSPGARGAALAALLRART